MHITRFHSGAMVLRGTLAMCRSLTRFGACRTPSDSPPRDKNEKGTEERRRRLFLAGFGCVMLTAAVAASTGIVIALLNWQPDPTCRSPGCQLYSEKLRASMDITVDPCQDFGRYVCGRYSHPRNFSVAEAAAQRYRDEVVAPVHNASLTGEGQNALQKSWRFYKSCEDVLGGAVDNTPYVVDALNDSGIQWPTPSNHDVNLVHAMVYLATRMAWPSIVDFAVEPQADDVVEVTISPSKYTAEVLQRRGGVNLTAYEDFFNVAVEHFSKAGGYDNTNTSAVNFSTMYNLENNYEVYYLKKAQEEVVFDENLEWVQNLTIFLKAELVQSMPDRVYPQSRLRIATGHVEFINWLIDQVLDHMSHVELVLGWHVVMHVAALTNRDLAVHFHKLVTGSGDPVWEHKVCTCREAHRYAYFRSRQKKMLAEDYAS
ncbi:uncharacterized protein [Dermacentor andersoni]|uniref:uncharacterized protein n=1 Tax=Dermacentor andersoni TaxID=34620 RepID=UPI002416CA08|nr:neprilysin-1-like [Dermacentor andersoni]